MSPEEREELVERIAQAVLLKIEERERINRISDMVVEQILTFQQQAEQIGSVSDVDDSISRTSDKSRVTE